MTVHIRRHGQIAERRQPTRGILNLVMDTQRRMHDQNGGEGAVAIGPGDECRQLHFAVAEREGLQVHDNPSRSDNIVTAVYRQSSIAQRLPATSGASLIFPGTGAARTADPARPFFFLPWPAASDHALVAQFGQAVFAQAQKAAQHFGIVFAQQGRGHADRRRALFHVGQWAGDEID